MSSASGASGGGGGLLVAILLVVVIGPTQAARSDDHDRDQHRSDHDDKVFLELKPDKVAPGDRIDIRAGCDDDGGDLRRNLDQRDDVATVRSPAFGEIMLVGDDDRLTGIVKLAARTEPGEYQARLHCPSGSSTRAKLTVLDPSRPARGPDTGGGGAEGDTGGTGGQDTEGNPESTADDGGATTGTALVAGAGLAALIVGSLLLARHRRASGSAGP